MKIVRLILVGIMAVVLTACGGGSGSPGTVVGGTNGGGAVAPPLTDGSVALTLTRGDGTVVTDNKLSQTEESFLKVTVKDSAGTAVDLVRVTFEVDSTEAVMVPSSGVALTRNGVATIKVSPTSVGSQGVVTAKASVTLNGRAISQEIFLDISPGTVLLQNLQATPSQVQKGQSIVTSVDVLVNGVKSVSNAVGIAFSSTCGGVSPQTALVDSNGKATAVVQTNAVGACVVTATYNSVSVKGGFNVTAPPITGIQFVSANPSRIYQSGSTASKTSIVSFKVIDSLGEGVPTIPVSAILTNTDGGINFCGSPHTSVNSDSGGIVSFSVCSGSLPATVQVRASIDTAPSVYTDSNLLTIQTGLPTQRFFDISASQLNYYVGGHFTSKFNGNGIEITVFAADRQGNPVPPGTPIVFVAEGGQLIASGSSSCLIGDTGRCSVTLVGQDYRPLGSPIGDPRPGRVTVLAYADGEESFVDAPNSNGIFNNRYDLGELFEDLGSPFLDKDESNFFSASYKNLVLGTDDGETIYPVDPGAIGRAVCPDNSNVGLSVQNTCNGRWDGFTKVRRQIVIVFSGGEIGQPGYYDSSIPAEKRTQVIGVPTRSNIRVQLSDYNGNPLPATASLSVEVLKSSGDCSAKLLGTLVGSSTEPTLHEIILDKCVGGESILLKSTVQSKESAISIPVP